MSARRRGHFPPSSEVCAGPKKSKIGVRCTGRNPSELRGLCRYYYRPENSFLGRNPSELRGLCRPNRPSYQKVLGSRNPSELRGLCRLSHKIMTNVFCRNPSELRGLCRERPPECRVCQGFAGRFFPGGTLWGKNAVFFGNRRWKCTATP